MSEKTSSPTIADVAREARVSISTVSRFLNGSSLVAQETEVRVRDAIQRLGYSPRSAARNLARRRTNTLGMLIDSIGTWFYAAVVSGAEEVAYANGYSLLIATPRQLYEGTLPALGPFNTDGLLMVNIQAKKKISAFYQDGYPIINLYQPGPRSLHVPLVTVDNKQGVCEAIDHLIHVHGIRRIGFLRGPKGNADSGYREMGYRQAMKRNGLPVDETLIGEGGFRYPLARKCIFDWHRKGILPQAIFTGNDEAALDVILALNHLGVRVPEDVALVGFDDDDLAPNLVPPLTTVHAPTQEVGRRGVLNLLRLIQTGTIEPVTQLPTYLVVRRSCGCMNLAESEAWPDPGQAVLRSAKISIPEEPG
jgi:DNA-binding LacI/PurR family transcriptional regulator